MTAHFKELLNNYYLQNVREAKCYACYAGKSILDANDDQFSEAHHENTSYRFKNYRRKNDYTAIPLCFYHHAIRHHANGMHSFWEKQTGDKYEPYYISMYMMKKFAKDTGLKIPHELLDAIDKEKIYTFSETTLRIFIDSMSTIVHYQYNTGDLNISSLSGIAITF